MGGSSPGEGVRLSERLVTFHHVCERRHNDNNSDDLLDYDAWRSGTFRRSVPEYVRRDDELLVVQVISEFGQVVHVRQLLPKLVTVKKHEETSERLTTV